jgi:hypothetical protein
MNPGDKVKVLNPFVMAFPGTYVIESCEEIEGGTAVHLEGIESAFDPRYLEVNL